MAKLTIWALLPLSSIVVIGCGRQGEQASGVSESGLASHGALGASEIGGARPGAAVKAYPAGIAPLTWVSRDKLVASDAAAGDFFGTSVALSGDLALVGAWSDDDAGEGSGSAYVFLRTASSWSEEQKLVASDAAAGDFFGTSVALSGNRALVGARGGNDAGASSGSAYVFLRTASSWSEEQKLVAGDAAPYDDFGTSVALSGYLALVGAWGDDDAGASSGSAYVFLRTASSWSEDQKLVASDAAAGDFFGTSVALSGNRALVGATGDDDGGSHSGSAYLFVRDAVGWSEEQKLVASDAAADDRFGFSVTLGESIPLVGATGDDHRGNSSGSAYIFSHLLVDGEICSDDRGCASAHCVDGYCCERACEGPCEGCSQVNLEGACSLLPRGSTSTSDCHGYRCSGSAEDCPKRCEGIADCTSEYHCDGAAVCLPRAVDGAACDRDEGCQSVHCVHGICCAQTCEGGCGSCTLSGFEGTCAPLPEGNSGTPTCAPYRCTGSDVACPTQCAAHHECAPGSHCVEGSCAPDEALGAACMEAAACDSGHCSDGVCCVAPSCGAYRCGELGACLESCSSSAQCAPGFACNSGGKCEELPDPTNTADGSCAYIVERKGAATPWRLAWLAALGMFLRSRRARKRIR